MEEKAGILEYVSTLQPIKGIIKYRYSDFMVNEINKQDEVIRLTNTQCDLELREEKPIALEECDLTAEQLDSLKNLKRLESTDILIEDMDKGRRTKMHQFIKANLPHLCSSTLKNEQQLSVIRVCYGNEMRRDSLMANKDHCLFTMFKENKSTLEAIENMCRLLRVKTSTFSFAGTKDKRAVTTQEITALRVEPKRLFHLNKALKNVVLGNFRITQTPLKLGDLNGNAFKIIMRKVTSAEEEIEKVMQNVVDNGFINYFGTQRFGTTQVCNSEIGKCIIKSDWMGAIDLIMKPRNEENAMLAECRKAWVELKDATKALKALQGFQCPERRLLEGLERYSIKNAVAALSLMPRNLRLMYLHAYQSLVWNKVASRRVGSHHLKVLVGDLYQKDGEEVKVVTEESLSEVGIEQIVLPLAGFDVQMPDNEVRCWIEEVLGEDQLQFASLKHKIRDYSLSGGYRKLLVKPKCLSWKLLDYKDDKAKLLNSDLDDLNGHSSPASQAPSDGQEHRALKLQFHLPSSSYATMLLREVTKEDTSSAHQATLN